MAGKEYIILITTTLMVLHPSCILSEECPRLPIAADYEAEKLNRTFPYALNVRGKNSIRKSEFLCDFIWTGKEHLKEKLLHRLTKRKKSFVRITVPVLGYNNPHLSMANDSGYLTWTWVLDSHEYMLYYPHNFIVLSVKTMGIITMDWAMDYHEDKVPVSLKQFGVDHDEFDTHNIVGYCDPECVKVNQSCGIGKYELEEFLLNNTEGKEQLKWNWLCLQAPYDVKDIVSVPSFAFPDQLYYWRFLKMLISRRPWFGTMQSKTDFPHYYCYNKQDTCEVKELVMHYWLVPVIGLILWVYSPLLVHYLPSSTPKKCREVPTSMFPSYKTPIYIGRCLKCMLCFYKQKGLPSTVWWVRLRRVLFLLALVVTSFRLLILPPYCYYSLPLLVITFVAVLLPAYLSEHISAELPSKFLNCNLPRGLVRVDNSLIEFQQLAHVMQERVYLVCDQRFMFKFVPELIFNSFKPRSCSFQHIILGLLAGIFTLIATPLALAYYFFPLPFFFMTLVHAIYMGECQYTRRQTSHCWSVLKACCHGMVMVTLLAYALIVTFTWCYAISEFTLFTFIGGALTPSMAFQYFVLTGSVVTAIYGLVRDLHRGYDHILEEMIYILKDNFTFTKLARDFNSKSGGRITLEGPAPRNEIEYSIIIRKEGELLPLCNVLIHDGITTYLNKDLFNDTVERCRPLRRQVLFIIIKIVAIVFYTVVAFWVKNVYHMEDQVGGIFQMLTTVSMYFLPSMLQFISYKSHFGKKMDIILRQEIFKALIECLTKL